MQGQCRFYCTCPERANFAARDRPNESDFASGSFFVNGWPPRGHSGETMIKLRAFSHRILLGTLFARVLSVVPAQAQKETAPGPSTPESANVVPPPSEQTEPAAEREGAEEALGLEVLLSNSALHV